MFEFMFIGLGFEVRHSRWHFKVGRPVPNWLIFVISTLGFGISFVPIGNEYLKENRAQRWKSDDTDEGRQKDFDKLIRSVPFLRSLEVRTHTPLKFSGLENLIHLGSFFTSTRIVDSPNFSKLKNLVMIAATHSSLQRISGLEKLEKLIYVHVSAVKPSFLNRLPSNVQSLFVRNAVPENADFARFPNLTHFSISDCAAMDISKLIGKCDNVVTMDIAGVRRILNMSMFEKAFPRVRRIAMVPETIEQFEELKSHVSNETDIRM